MSARQDGSFWSDSLLAGMSNSPKFLALVLYNVLIPNMVGIRIFGEATLALSAGYLLAAFIETGPDNLGVLYLSPSRGKDKQGVSRATVVLIHKLLLGVLLGLVLFLLAPSLERLYGLDALYFRLSALSVPLLGAHTFLIAASLAVSRTRLAVLAQLIYAVVHPLLPLALFFLGYSDVGTLILCALFSPFLVALFLGTALVRNGTISSSLKDQSNCFAIRSTLSKAIGLGTPRWASLFFTSVIVLIAGKLLSVEAAGYLRITTSLVKGAVAVMPVSSPFLLASFLRARSQGKVAEIRSYLTWYVGGGALYGVSIGVAVLLLGRPLLRLLYPQEYEPIFLLLRVMSWAVAPLLFKELLDNWALSASRPATLVTFNASALAGAVTLAVWLGSIWSEAGVAWAFTMSAVGMATGLYLIFFRPGLAGTAHFSHDEPPRRIHAIKS